MSNASSSWWLKGSSMSSSMKRSSTDIRDQQEPMSFPISPPGYKPGRADNLGTSVEHVRTGVVDPARPAPNEPNWGLDNNALRPTLVHTTAASSKRPQLDVQALNAAPLSNPALPLNGRVIPPEPIQTPELVARQVPEPAREAVAAADQSAAPQLDLAEKQAATARRIRGDEPEGTVIEGIEDDALWVMLRRFNKQVNHVLHPALNVPLNQPDLRHTNLPNVPYRSDTLKANLERLLAGLGPPAVRGTQELMRLTDWENEFNRTAMYCGAYFLAWGFGCTVLAGTAFLALLVCFPGTRRILFPYVSHRHVHADASVLREDHSCHRNKKLLSMTGRLRLSPLLELH